MRIALVSNILPPFGRGGAEAYVARLGSTLAAEGHDVLILSGSPGKVEGAEIRQLPHLPRLEPSAPYVGKLLWHARDQWLPSVYRAMIDELREFRPQLVHTHECQGLSASVFSAIHRLELPHVYTAHDLNLLCARVSMTRDGANCGGSCGFCRVQRTIRGGAVRRHLTTLISVSEFIQRQHVEAGVVPAARAVVIRLGADSSQAAPRTLSGDGLRLGFLGAVSRHKGVGTLLECFAGAPENWSLTIAGSGDMSAAVEEAARRDGRISHLGQIGEREKNSFFWGIDTLVVPSEWEEPAALVSAEAIARGIPVVVSDRGGLPETPEGFVFSAGSSRALRGALDALAADPEIYAAVSARLYDRREDLSWDTHQRRVSAVYDAAVAAPVRSA
jgi:glycosyltransferase involved in cell wall biosynthesis